MYTNLASGLLIVLGTAIAVLGFVLAGEMVMVVIGLGSVGAGGILSVLDRRLSR